MNEMGAHIKLEIESVARKLGPRLTSLRLLPRCLHRLGKRLPAPLQLSHHPVPQIRGGPHLADELADHVRRGEVAGPRGTAEEPVQIRQQVNGDPGRPP